MYKVVFVDDEKYVLSRVATAIDWNKNGFDFAAKFSRSEHVIEYLENNPVDLLITDIKMPNVTGLDLVRICQERFPHVIVVLLSAYQLFEYAQKAMEFNAFAYLTKPLDYKEITELLSKVKSTLDARYPTRFFPDRQDRAALQQLFSDMVYGSLFSADELKKALRNDHPEIDPLKSACKILTIHIFDFANYINTTWKHPVDKLYDAISAMIPYQTMHYTALSFRCFLNYVEFFVISKENKGDFDGCVERLVSDLKSELAQTLNLNCEIQPTEEYSSLVSMLENKTHDTTNVLAFENEIICKADEYIKAHYNEPITLKDLAAHTNLSYKYFGNYFKTHTGYNFVAYLNLYRLKKAVEFLEDKNLTITEVCERSGFANQTFFYNFFRKSYHMSPNQYRKMVINDRHIKMKNR